MEKAEKEKKRGRNQGEDTRSRQEKKRQTRNTRDTLNDRQMEMTRAFLPSTQQ